MQETYHNNGVQPQSDVIVTTGSQDGLCKAFEMVLNTNDWIVIQEPIYAGTLAIASVPLYTFPLFHFFLNTYIF